MNAEQKMVKDFHSKYRCVINDGGPRICTPSELFLRARLIQEEASEFTAAATNEDMVGMADALCDILYVVYGTGVALGVDLEPIFAEVQRSNMTKDGGGQDSGGKVIKGPNWSPPDIKSKLIDQGWENV
jgi:predicted HAD superfamily Cof-like phosphohydrolase